MKQKTLCTPQGTVHYWIEGTGTDHLFFTHGLALDHHVFDPQIPFFSKDYTIITWDLPMHGQSRPYDRFSQTDAVEWIIRIMDNEGLSQAHHLGLSLGGYILQELALKYPERIASIALVGSHPLGKGYYRAPERWLINHIHQFLPFLPYRVIIETVGQFANRHAAGRKATKRALVNHSKEEIKELARLAYRDFLAFEEPVHFDGRIPVRLFHGERDFTGRLQPLNKTWAANEGLVRIPLPDAAHNAHNDTPEQFNALYAQFLWEVAHFEALIETSQESALE